MDNMTAFKVNQPDNPTNAERYTMARAALTQKGRPEDFEYIKTLLSPPPEITTIASPGQFKGIKVGIIGGGLAGLAAAFELKKLGFDITVFDALKDRIGGRVYTYYFDTDKKLYGELGPMRIPVIHETVWHYINLFKLDTRPFIHENENALIYLKNVRVRNDPDGRNVMQYIYPKYDLKPWERSVPWQQLSYLGIESHLLSASAEERSEIFQIRPFYNQYILNWDYNNSRQMIESTQLGNNAINLISNFYPLMGQDLYSSYLDYIQEQYSADLSYLYEIHGGIVNLPLAFYKAVLGKNNKEAYPGIPTELFGNVEYRAGLWVTGIHRNPENGKVILGFQRTGTEKTVYENFDYAICAIPFSTLRTVHINPLFSIRKMQAIREVNYIPSQKTYFLCKERFWENGGPEERIIGGASYTDLPISQIYYPSQHVYNNIGRTTNIHRNPSNTNAVTREPGVLLASYNFNLETTRLAEISDSFRFEEIKREVEQVHGLPLRYLDSIVSQNITLNWNNDPRFRGALCYYTPEQRRLFSFDSVTPEYDGRLFFAGEHTSYKHRWMQGALKSGMDAANNLAIYCIHNMQ